MAEQRGGLVGVADSRRLPGGAEEAVEDLPRGLADRAVEGVVGDRAGAVGCVADPAQPGGRHAVEGDPPDRLEVGVERGADEVVAEAERRAVLDEEAVGDGRRERRADRLGGLPGHGGDLGQRGRPGEGGRDVEQRPGGVGERIGLAPHVRAELLRRGAVEEPLERAGVGGRAGEDGDEEGVAGGGAVQLLDEPVRRRPVVVGAEERAHALGVEAAQRQVLAGAEEGVEHCAVATTRTGAPASRAATSGSARTASGAPCSMSSRQTMSGVAAAWSARAAATRAATPSTEAGGEPGAPMPSGAAPPSARRTCCHSQCGGVPSADQQRPNAARTPRDAAAAQAASTRAVLPTPGSPVMTSGLPVPASARSSAVSTTASSSARPTRRCPTRPGTGVTTRPARPRRPSR
jgi:hypothetical protein